MGSKHENEELARLREQDASLRLDLAQRIQWERVRSAQVYQLSEELKALHDTVRQWCTEDAPEETIESVSEPASEPQLEAVIEPIETTPSEPDAIDLLLAEVRRIYEEGKYFVYVPSAKELRDPEEQQGRSRHAIRSARIRKTRSHTNRNVSLRVLQKSAKEFPEPVYHPKERSECRGGPRPCPLVGCKWNLYLDVSEKGTIKYNFPDLQPEDMQVSCALDVIEAGMTSALDIAAYMNLTREGVRLLELRAKAKLLAATEFESIEDVV